MLGFIASCCMKFEIYEIVAVNQVEVNGIGCNCRELTY